MSQIAVRTLSQAAAALRAGTLTARSLVQHCLHALEKQNPLLNAVLYSSKTVYEEAAQLDAMADKGEYAGPLHGIPLFIKDNIDVQNMPSTKGSVIFDSAPRAAADAVVVARLKAAGAIIMGKTNMDEFAAHVSGITAFRGPTVNPWQRQRRLSPGGSSSGTAASIAAGFCCGGLGTDTGGSVRLPAGWCGLCGIRPTHGHISMQGVYPRAVSMDTVGAMAHSVEDVALLLQIIADPTLQQTLPTHLMQPLPMPPLRVGIPTQFIAREAAPDVRAVFDTCLALWRRMGIECVDVDIALLDTPEVVECIGLLRSYEFTRDVAQDVEASPRKQRMHAIPMADYLQGKAVTESAYQQVLDSKRLYTEIVHKSFKQYGVDMFMLPTAATTAPPIDAAPEAYKAGRKFNNLFSITDVPTLVVPAGLTSQGLPIGMQLVGQPLHEHMLLTAGMAYETHNGPFHRCVY